MSIVREIANSVMNSLKLAILRHSFPDFSATIMENATTLIGSITIHNKVTQDR